MAYQVLARKWRPQVFEEVIGQPFVVKTLQNALSSGRLGQAYLFCGPRGVGKTTVARILAKALNCRIGPGPNPCNICSSCKEITAGISPDVQEIDGASNRGIEEIRNLRENVKYLPTLGKKRVFIIDEVHMLTIHAFNALLKTLEEPPSHVVFIFATTEPHKVPATILSRCQRFDFRRIPPEEMARHLLRVAQKEGIQIEDAAIELIVKRSEGSMRDAQSLLDQLITFVGPKVTHEEVEELLGEIESALVSEACIAIAERNPKGIFETVKIAYEKGYDLKEFYKAIMEIFKDALYYLSGAEAKDLGIPPWKEDLILRITRSLSPEILSILLGLMLKHFELLRYTDEIRILLEVILVRLSIGGELLPLGKLLDALSTRSDTPTLPISERVAGQAHVGSEEGGLPQRDTKAPKDWEGFLESLKKKKPMVSRSLSHWEIVSLKEDELVLVPPEHPVLKDYLKDPQKISELSQFLKEYFGKEIRVTVRERKEDLAERRSAISELIKRFGAQIVPNGTIQMD